jgi:hypothetical protein
VSSGVEADIALDAAVIASLGLVRVLGGAAGLASAGAGALASLMEGLADARERRLEEVRRHESALGEVLDRNARIAALTDSAARHGADVALPDPFEPSGRSSEELLAWITEVDAGLAAAEEGLSTAIAAKTAGLVFAGGRDAAHRSLRVEPDGDRVVAEAAPDWPASVEETLARVLARLLPDSSDDDLRAVTEAAGQVAAASTPSEAESLLTEVRIRLQAANERTRERRDGRAAAARFLRELQTHPAAEDVRARLGDVIAGKASFDDSLRAEAVRLVRDVQERDEHRYVTNALREAFGELGYDLTEGFETMTARDGEAVLTRGDWPQHAVRVRIDDARLVRMALLRTEPAESDDQRRLDIEREEQWCESFDAARERLAEAGVRADVRWRVEPGAQRLPVARRARPRQRQRERRREQDR